MEKIKKLSDLLREIKNIQSIEALLSWDQETYMPSGSGEIRSEQIAYLSELGHRLHTGRRFKSQLEKLVDLESGQPQTAAEPADPGRNQLLYLIWKDFKQASALPGKFVQKLAVHAARSQQVWSDFRRRDDFNSYIPYLEEMVRLKREEADFYGYANEPYDALIDLFEPGMTARRIEHLFTEIRDPLVALIERISGSNTVVDDQSLIGNYPLARQKRFVLKIAEEMGYRFDHGRLDTSAHPFTTSFHPTDVRITSRFSASDFRPGFFAVIHEAGHALYEQGLKDEFYGTPFGEAVSYGFHESQSRLWENLVCRSRAFWCRKFDQLKKTFPQQLSDLELDSFYPMINRVRPSLIRVEADEVTYSLHIMLRFEIERDLISGNLAVTDLPAVWNEKMEKYLHIKPTDNRDGVMQDIHWSFGGFGYFPTYTLGNIFSVPMMTQAFTELTDLGRMIQNGELSHLKEWLGKNIHTFGRRYQAEQLIQKLTGQPLSALPYLEYLTDKYSDIYKL